MGSFQCVYMHRSHRSHRLHTMCLEQAAQLPLREVGVSSVLSSHHNATVHKNLAFWVQLAYTLRVRFSANPHGNWPVRRCESTIIEQHTKYTVSQKMDLYTFAHNFGRCWRIFEIFPLLNSSRNLQQTDCHTAHHTLGVLLHYLVRWQLSQTAIFISKQCPKLWQILTNALIFGHKNTAVLLV